MITYLYIKTHTITGLKYLGKTTQDPFKYNGSGKYWKLHLNKHGNEHDTEILMECQTNEEVSKWGLYYSELYNVVESPEWANLKLESGDGGSSGVIKSPETRAKISEANRNRSPETRAKMSASMKAAMTPERRANLSKKAKAAMTPERRAKIGEAARNRIISPETRAKLSAARKDRIITPETRAKLSAAAKKQITSPEARAKMSASAKARYAALKRQS